MTNKDLEVILREEIKKAREMTELEYYGDYAKGKISAYLLVLDYMKEIKVRDADREEVDAISSFSMNG